MHANVTRKPGMPVWACADVLCCWCCGAGYQAFLVQQSLDKEEPPPVQPTVSMGHSDYKFFVDFRRVDYIRNKQHKDICTWVWQAVRMARALF